MDIGAWVGIVGLLLAIPVGIMSHVLGHRILLYLEKRKLIRQNQTREQAIARYRQIKAFHEGKKDKYAFYLQVLGWSVLCAVGCSTSIIVIILIYPDFGVITPGSLGVIPLLLAVAFFVISLVLMMLLYDTSRHLERFDKYRKEFEEQWGTIDD